MLYIRVTSLLMFCEKWPHSRVNVGKYVNIPMEQLGVVSENTYTESKTVQHPMAFIFCYCYNEKTYLQSRE